MLLEYFFTFSPEKGPDTGKALSDRVFSLERGAPNSGLGAESSAPFFLPLGSEVYSRVYSSQVLLQLAASLCRPSRLSTCHSGQALLAAATLGNSRCDRHFTSWQKGKHGSHWGAFSWSPVLSVKHCVPFS